VSAVYLWAVAGGAIGSAARFALAIAITARTGPRFPWATLAINIIGSLVIGIAGPLAASPELRGFVMAGLCGGFTTFSSFSLQTVELMRENRPRAALAYAWLSACLCLAATWLGYAGSVAAGGAG
jgi:CrcB protein